MFDVLESFYNKHQNYKRYSSRIKTIISIYDKFYHGDYNEWLKYDAFNFIQYLLTLTDQ